MAKKPAISKKPYRVRGKTSAGYPKASAKREREIRSHNNLMDFSRPYYNTNELPKAGNVESEANKQLRKKPKGIFKPKKRK